MNAQQGKINGDKLRAIRTNMKLPLWDVCIQTEIAASTLSKMETGKIRDPNRCNLIKLIRFYNEKDKTLNLTIDSLYDDSCC